MPRYLQQHVDLIKPTVHFNHRPTPNALVKHAGGLGQPFSNSGSKNSSKLLKTLPSLAKCDQKTTLDCLRALYKINYTPHSTDKNTFGIGNLIAAADMMKTTHSTCHLTVEFTPQAYLASDLDMFFRYVSNLRVFPVCFNDSFQEVFIKSGWREASSRLDRWRFVIFSRTKIAMTKISSAVIQTTNQSSDFNLESSLDLEYGMALTNPQSVTLLQVGDLVQS